MTKLKRGEAVVAAILILVIAAAALVFVFRSDKKSTGNDMSQKQISAVSLSGNEEFPKPKPDKTVTVSENKKYVSSFMLDAATFLEFDDAGKYFLTNTLGERIDRSEFLDDLGNRLSVYIKDGTPHFMTDMGEVKTFLVNGKTVEILDNTVYISLIAMKKLTDEKPEVTTKASTEAKKTETKKTESKSKKETDKKETAQALVLNDEAQIILLADENNEQNETKADDKKESAKTKKTAKTTTTKKKTTTTKTTTSPRTLPTTTTTLPKYSPIDSYAAELLRLVNVERTNRGLSELVAKNSLDQSALSRAKETALSFSHTRPDNRDLKTIMSDYGLSFKVFGENIAAGQKSAIDVVSDWMSSDAARKNILNPSYKYFGSSHYYADDDENYRFDYWTACFYTPLSEETTEERERPVPNDSKQTTAPAKVKESKETVSKQEKKAQNTVKETEKA